MEKQLSDTNLRSEIFLLKFLQASHNTTASTNTDQVPDTHAWHNDSSQLQVLVLVMLVLEAGRRLYHSPKLS